MSLTDTQIDKYLAEHGYACPYCDNPELNHEGPEYLDAGQAFSDVECPKCHKEWREYFKLYDIEEWVPETKEHAESTYRPLVWLIRVSYLVQASYVGGMGRGGICFKAAGPTEYDIKQSLADWCCHRWQEMGEPDGRCLETEGCPEDMSERYFNFMEPEETYQIESLRLGREHKA